MTEEMRRRILNPPPGSALARARDHGMDLTLLARNLDLTPKERLERAIRSQAMLRFIDRLRAAKLPE